MLGNLIGGFVVIIIGVSLMPTVADEVFTVAGNSSSSYTNLSSASLTITNLIPLFYALGILSAGIALTAQGLRAAGLVGV